MDNYGIMITMQKKDLLGNGYTEVHVMWTSVGNVYGEINFNKLDEELIPDTLREYVLENSEKVKSGRWHYSGKSKK